MICSVVSIVGSNPFDSAHVLPVISTDACNYWQQRIHNIVIAERITRQTCSTRGLKEDCLFSFTYDS